MCGELEVIDWSMPVLWRERNLRASELSSLTSVTDFLLGEKSRNAMNNNGKNGRISISGASVKDLPIFLENCSKSETFHCCRVDIYLMYCPSSYNIWFVLLVNNNCTVEWYLKTEQSANCAGAKVQHLWSLNTLFWKYYF